MAYRLDQLLPATSAVQITLFFPIAALPMAAIHPLISMAGAGTPWGQYALPSVPVLRSHSWPVGRTAVVRRGCVNLCRSSWSAAGLWPWDSCDGSGGEILGRTGSTEPITVHQPQCSHTWGGQRCPRSPTSIQDHHGRASAARRESSLR